MNLGNPCGFIISQFNGEITLQQREQELFNLFGMENKGMTIVPNGYIGFGTPYPMHKIHVVDENILISKTSSPKAPGSPNGSMLFGADVSSHTPYGEWGIEYLNSPQDGYGLNFWKAWTSYHQGFNYALFLADNGNVGVGKKDPQSKLDVAGNIRSTGLFINHTEQVDWSYASHIKVNRDLTKAFVISNMSSGTENTVFQIWGNGVVNAKKIYADDITVALNTMNCYWYDHVFASEYKLCSLKELEQFIRENKHLPEIPSAQEVEKNGINLGEMQGKLLLKVEELTLYLIEQQKLIEELQKHLSELEDREGGE